MSDVCVHEVVDTPVAYGFSRHRGAPPVKKRKHLT